MHLSHYQHGTRITAKYPADRAIEYLALGLASEAGEVAGKVKKIIRDRDGHIGPDERIALALEIGDVLWYCARLADELKMDFDFVGEANINKLIDRQQRGQIGGSGDNR